MATVDEPARASAWPASATQAQGGGRAVLLALFLFACLLPINLFLGDFRVDPYRIVLLAMFIPAAGYIFAGQAGSVTRADLLMLCFGVWIMVTMIRHHGQWGLINGGITVVELVGAYLLGRMLVRSAEDYRRFIRFFMITLVLIAPFALAELLTGRWVIGDILGQFFRTHPRQPTAPRWGLNRVQGIASHSILFGVYCAIGFANAYYLYRRQVTKMVVAVVFVSAMVFSSLSAGPLLAVQIQVAIIAWGILTKENWRKLLIISVIGYVVIDMLSNRGPMLIILETFTFSTHTTWTRINIYNYGSAEVMRNPIFGIGFNPYSRPGWLTPSVDNYWLLTALRHGLVGLIFLATALAFHVWRIVRTGPISAEAGDARLAYMVTFVGLAFALATVHIWNSVASIIFFYFGAGAFLYTSSSVKTDEVEVLTKPEASASPGTASSGPVYRRTPLTNTRSEDPTAAPARPPAPAPEQVAPSLRREAEAEAPRILDESDRYRR